MPGIVCAIRGGPASQPTIKKSIELATQTGQEIFFLYVVNLDFLTRSTSSKTKHIAQEMREMGELILLDTVEGAKAQGVKAEMTVSEGDVIDEIITLCLEKNADYVVLGRPDVKNRDNLIAENQYQTIIDQIEDNTKANVVLSS